MVRHAKRTACRIFYARRPEFETAEEKLSFLSTARARDLESEEIRPDSKHNWIGQADSEFESLLALGDKNVKASANIRTGRAVFKLFIRGVETRRDDWVYDDSDREPNQ